MPTPRSSSPSSPRGGCRIVLVEDEEDSRELIADILTLHGHTVRTLSEGQAAVAEILRDPPDVALVDIGMPDMDGYQVARAIHLQMGERRPRLIALTGYGQASDRADALAAGFDEHIIKPISYSALEAVLDRVRY